MTKTRVRVTSGFLWVALTFLGFYSPNTANAETYTATQEQRDFYFISQEASVMTVRTYAQQFGIDSMLWIYDDQNNLITANDDYFGLDSFVQFNMSPGVTYRLRAGVCCWNPDAWYGNSYTIEPSTTPINAPIQTTTTTVEPTTTLPEPSTTSEPPTTTTTEPPTTTSTTTTTTLPETTTTLRQTTTTLYVVPVTEPPTTTSTSVESTTTSSTTTSSTTTSTTSTTSTIPATTTTSQTSTTTSTTTTVLPTTTTVPPTTTTSTVPPVAAIGVTVEALQELTSTEAEEVFAAVDEDALTDEQADQLVEAVQDAPEEVRAAFEEEVNIFSGKFDNYVPLGSTVSVATRKAIVAASGVLFMAPAVPVSSTSASSNSQSSGRRK